MPGGEVTTRLLGERIGVEEVPPHDGNDTVVGEDVLEYDHVTDELVGSRGYVDMIPVGVELHDELVIQL